MRSFILPTALLAAWCANAIQITSPAKGDVVDLSSGVTVSWSTVSTDPSRAHLFLVNMAAGNTPFSKDLGEIDLSKGSIVITEKDVPAEEGYQFNFQSTSAGNTGILAQSEQFEVEEAGADSGDEDEDDKSSTTAADSSTSGTATAKTTATTSGASAGAAVTTTVSTTLSTAVSSASVTGTASREGSASSTATDGPTSTGGAAAGSAVQGGSLLALVAGVLAVIA